MLTKNIYLESDGTTKGGKRKSKTAELESGSLVIGRQAVVVVFYIYAEESL